MAEEAAKKRVTASPGSQDKVLTTRAELFNNELLSDFRVHIGCVTVPLHKAILYTRCSYYKTFFLTNEKDRKPLFPSLWYSSHHAYWRALQFIYTTKYSDVIVDIPGVEDDDATVQDVRVYRLAYYMEFPRLKKYSLDRFTAKLDDICQNERFPSVIREIYKASSDREDVLRVHVVSACQKHFAKLWALDEFKALVRDGGDFVEDLMNTGALIKWQ